MLPNPEEKEMNFILLSALNPVFSSKIEVVYFILSKYSACLNFKTEVITSLIPKLIDRF